MGIKKNDKIAVISSSNRTEWNIMDIGVLQTGAQTCPSTNITEDDYEYILNHSGAILFLFYLMQNTSKSKFNKDKVPNLKEVFSFTLLKVVKTGRITSSWQGPKQSN
jgi:long-chain acyl-CoA synthetase